MYLSNRFPLLPTTPRPFVPSNSLTLALLSRFSNIMMVWFQYQLFVLHDCLQRLRQELLHSDPSGVSLDPVFQQTLQSPMEPESIETVWKERMRGNKRLAEVVAVGLSAVLSQVKVETRVAEEVRRLKDVAENAALGNEGNGHEYADLTLSDTETSLHYAIVAEKLTTPICIHPSFQGNSTNSPITKTIAAAHSSKKGPKLPDTPLSLLLCAKGPRHYPKLENFRLKLIRGTMRSIREFTRDARTYPVSGTHAIDPTDPQQIRLYSRLKEQFFLNKADLLPFGSTQKGPETNKYRNKTKVRTHGTRPSSFNDAFCRKFLDSEARLDYFQLYLDLVFSGNDCEWIGRRLKVKCCAQSVHSAECAEVWRRVKEFASWGLLERLGLGAPERFFTTTASS